jgi:hypothetical protein
MKDDHQKNLASFWPLCQGFLENADTQVKWASQSEWRRLSNAERRMTNKKNLHKLHRHIRQMLYMHCTGIPGQSMVWIVILDDDIHCAIVANTENLKSHLNHFRIIFSRNLRDVLNTPAKDAFYDSCVRPHLMNVFIG